MWQRFTERARKVVFYAQEEAQKFGEGYVSTEHLLLGLVRESDSVAARVLEKLGVSLARIRAEVEKQLSRGDARPSQDMTLTPRSKRVIDLAYDEARNLNNNYIGTEHLLLGLIREGDGVAGRVLWNLGIDLDAARNAVMEIQDQEGQGRRPFPPAPEMDEADGSREWEDPVTDHPAESDPPLAGRPWHSFNAHLRKVVFYAQEEAQKFGEGYLSTEHLLLGLLRQRNSMAARIIEKLGVSLNRIRAEVEKQLPRGDARPSQDMTLTPRAKRVIDLAEEEARNLKRTSIGTEHLLLGLIKESDGLAGRVLAKLKVELENVRAEAMKAYSDRSWGIDPPRPAGGEPKPASPRSPDPESPAGSKRGIAGTVVSKLIFARDEGSGSELLAPALLADSVIITCLEKLGISREAATDWVEEWVVDRFVPNAGARQILPPPTLTAVLALASEHAQAPGQVTAGDLLVAFFVHEQNALAQFLLGHGVTLEKLKAALRPD